MNLKYVLLGMLYFVQGIPYGLQSGLLPVYLRTLGHSFTRISLAKVLYMPWILKVMWAPLVDHYFGKKTWLMLTMSGLALACLGCSLTSPEVSFLPVAGIFLLMNFFASIQDIAVDGVAVQLLVHEEVGYGNTIQVVAYKLGSVMAGGGLLTFLHYLGWGALFIYLAVVYALAIGLTWISDLRVKQRRASMDSYIRASRSNPWRIFRDIIYVPDTPWTAGFVFIYKLGEQGAIAMFPLFLLDHDFSPQKLGFWNGVVSMVFSIAGSSLGGHLIPRQSGGRVEHLPSALRGRANHHPHLQHDDALLAKGPGEHPGHSLQLPGHPGSLGQAGLQHPGGQPGGRAGLRERLRHLPLPLLPLRHVRAAGPRLTGTHRRTTRGEGSGAAT
ncbi:major facilitator superfamily domain-containing protein 3 isoform X4 [Pogona vitticeps]